MQLELDQARQAAHAGAAPWLASRSCQTSSTRTLWAAQFESPKRRPCHSSGMATWLTSSITPLCSFRFYLQG
ncbi:rCG42879 [Rattus norvegicus]|uniref:RCG42879 n=1 Tax=Rattus norvegicus TaxID=10116 RepID=A6JZY1_RAT|nr:rCG42879 [Rattus norvegicus]